MSSVNQWDYVLTETARSIIPKDGDLRSAKQIADQVFDALRTRSGYRIDRQYIAGSMGKATVINIKPDYDCVIFVNGIEPPYESVIANFEKILRTLQGVTVQEAKRPRKVLQINIRGLDFDITPAINFSQNKEEQRRLTMQRISNAKDGYIFSSCLAEFAVDFVKQQSAFVHDVIRLAKYWNKQVEIKDYISARSSIMECIAVHVGQKEDNKFYGRSLSVAFKDFLEMIANFPMINIRFDNYYRPSEIKHHILSQRPLVMDPVNPNNNLAHSFVSKPHAMAEFQRIAKVTLRRMTETRYPRGESLFQLH